VEFIWNHANLWTNMQVRGWSSFGTTPTSGPTCR
jgi:hypothetical protein